LIRRVDKRVIQQWMLVRKMLLRDKKLKTSGVSSCKLCFFADIEEQNVGQHIFYLNGLMIFKRSA
jgi:hypothetical protein